MNGFMNMLDTLSKLRIHYTNLHTHNIYIYIYIYIYIVMCLGRVHSFIP